MKTLKRTRYYTLNPWNVSTAPAYNLKIYKVIDDNLLATAYELLEVEDFWLAINHLVERFGAKHDYQWQAGFNGKSGGYLVLYRGGKYEDGRVYSQPGLSIEEKEVPADVLRAFRRLALDIVKTTENFAKTYRVKEEEYQLTETRKILVQDGK